MTDDVLVYLQALFAGAVVGLVAWVVSLAPWRR